MRIDLSRRSLAGRELAGASVWGAVELIARYGTQMVLLLLLGRLLAPEEFGLMAIVMVFASVGLILTDAGLGASLVQLGSVDRDHETTAFVSSLAFAVAAGAALWVSAPWIAEEFSQPILARILRWLVILLPAGALSAVPDALILRAMHFRIRAGVEVLSSTLAGVVAIALAYAHRGVWSLVALTVVAAATRAVALWFWTGWRPTGKVTRNAFQSLWRFGSYVMSSALLDNLATRFQALTLGAIFNPRVVGQYSMAQNLQQSPTLFAARLIERLGFPYFSSRAPSPEGLAPDVKQWNRTVLFLFLPVPLLLVLTSRDLVELLLGIEWADVSPILVLLSLAVTVWPIHVINLIALKAMGRSDLFFRLEVAKKVVAFSGIVVGSSFGAVGVAWSAVGASAWALFVNTYYSRRLLRYGLIAQLRDVGSTFLVGAAALFPAWWTAGRFEELLPRLCVGAIVLIGVYVFAAWLVRIPALTSLLALLRERGRKPSAGGL